MSGLTKDDITRMAREAGWDDHHAEFDTRIGRFANLVAAATLKNSVMTDEEYEQAMADEGQRRMLTFDTEVREMVKEAVEMEREACAQICEEHYTYYGYEYMADAIRGRGNDAT